VKHFQAKKLKMSSTIQKPFVRFDCVHSPFDWTLTPSRGSSSSNCIIISVNTIDKTDEFLDLTLTHLFHPSVQEIRLQLTYHVKKRVKKAIEVADFLRTLEELRQALLFFWCQIALLFGKQPTSLSR
jgi:hypothetical protein